MLNVLCNVLMRFTGTYVEAFHTSIPQVHQIAAVQCSAVAVTYLCVDQRNADPVVAPQCAAVGTVLVESLKTTGASFLFQFN